MNIEIIKGNIFNSSCQTIVNTINCVGIMGAGIALEFRFRYPQMYDRYQELCQQKLIDIGKLWLYKNSDKWILNFPTKKHWKNPSQQQYLELGLQKFLETYEERRIESIAFPLLGAKNGGIPENTSLKIMKEYLSKCRIPVEIYYYDPQASDSWFEKFRHKFLAYKVDDLIQITGINKNYILKIRDTLQLSSINNISQLLKVKGIGINSISKALIIVK